jgi:hypothetical protein
VRKIVAGLALGVGALAWGAGIWRLSLGDVPFGTCLVVAGGLVAFVSLALLRQGKNSVSEMFVELLGEWLHRG